MLVEFATPVDDAVRDTLKDLEGQVWEIKNRCLRRGHTIIKKSVPDIDGEYPHWGAAICYVCNQSLGWYCPKSLEGYCEYETVLYSPCKYCGQPRERK